MTVQQLAPKEFSWRVVQRRDGHLAECVAEASELFPDFEQALESGFEALKAKRWQWNSAHAERIRRAGWPQGKPSERVTSKQPPS